MKSRLLITLLLTVLLVPTFTGCGLRTLDIRLDRIEDVVENRLDTVEEAIEKPLDIVEDAVENSLAPEMSPRSTGEATRRSTQTITESTPKNNNKTSNNSEKKENLLTKSEAEVIALEHAGFSSDEVIGLHTEYDFDDGIAIYEIQFHNGYWEYEYDIHAETGVVLSFDKDN